MKTSVIINEALPIECSGGGGCPDAIKRGDLEWMWRSTRACVKKRSKQHMVGCRTEGSPAHPPTSPWALDDQRNQTRRASRTRARKVQYFCGLKQFRWKVLRRLAVPSCRHTCLSGITVLVHWLLYLMSASHPLVSTRTSHETSDQ